MKSLHGNHTFDLVMLPKDRKSLKNRWVFRVKYKARLVVKSFNQKKGIYFDEIFSLVVKMSFVRVVLGLVASLDLEVVQMDVKLLFSMVTWMKKFIWSSQKTLKSRKKRIMFAS